MTENKSCKNCGWSNAWKDGASCPFERINMCNSTCLKMWAEKTNNDIPKPDPFARKAETRLEELRNREVFSALYFGEPVKPKIMTNKEAAAILTDMLDTIGNFVPPRGNGKTLYSIRYKAICRAIEVLEETPDD